MTVNLVIGNRYKTSADAKAVGDSYPIEELSGKEVELISLIDADGDVTVKDANDDEWWVDPKYLTAVVSTEVKSLKQALDDLLLDADTALIEAKDKAQEVRDEQAKADAAVEAAESRVAEIKDAIAKVFPPQWNTLLEIPGENNMEVVNDTGTIWSYYSYNSFLPSVGHWRWSGEAGSGETERQTGPFRKVGA